MPPTFPLIYIRLRQLRRQAIDLGFLYLILMSGILLALILGAYAIYHTKEMRKEPLYLSSFLCATVLLIHISRKDKQFVSNHVQRASLNMFMEYVLFLSPFLFVSLFSTLWYHAFLILLIVYSVSSLRWSVKLKTRLPHLSKLIPSYYFEWISGIRKNYILIGVITLAAIATCWMKFVPLVCLWFFTAIISSFYQEGESLFILSTSYKGAKAFLFSKIKRHVSLLLMLAMPLLLINTIIHPDMWWINLIFGVALVVLLVFAILLKYSIYTPNEELKAGSILLSIAVISVAIPFLFPLPLLMSIRHYGRAKANLKSLLTETS